MALAENILRFNTDIPWAVNLALALNLHPTQSFEGVDPESKINYQAVMFQFETYQLYLAKKIDDSKIGIHFDVVAISDLDDKEQVALYNVSRVQTDGGRFRIILEGEDNEQKGRKLIVDRRGYKAESTSPHS